jgi:hypothetical protein
MRFRHCRWLAVIVSASVINFVPCLGYAAAVEAAVDA